MTAYYNEHDPKAAAWLRELIKRNLIAPGVVDERSIEDVIPDELVGYTQCHFFAGIGVWSYALRQAGWDDDRRVWTGSCPCQPFSAAGKRTGTADERHLWPAFFHLISQCRPDVVFGEQVASKDGLAWLDLVRSDLEGASYAVGAADLCAAGFGAPHIRQRLYWVADSHGQQTNTADQRRLYAKSSEGGDIGRVADADDSGLQRLLIGRDGTGECIVGPSRLEGQGLPCPTNGFWGNADWLYCRDGKWRPVESGTFPLVDGAAARVGRLRGYGNAIVAPVAKAFISAYVEINSEPRENLLTSSLK